MPLQIGEHVAHVRWGTVSTVLDPALVHEVRQAILRNVAKMYGWRVIPDSDDPNGRY